MKRIAALLLGLAALGAVVAYTVASAPVAPLQLPPATDHHLHILSPETAKTVTAICAKLGIFECPPILSFKPSNGQNAIDALDRAGVRRGVLLSTAYVFGSPEAAGLGLNLAGETRRENAFVVAQARAHCERLVAFVSVNPLAANALDEIAYWGRAGGAAGLKIHLQNSDFDFRSPAQVRKLATVFAAAAAVRFPIVIHMRTRAKDYGAQDVAIFLKDVLPYASGVVVQIAHAAGSGGEDESALYALDAFARAIKRDPGATANLYFDVAMVPNIEMGIILRIKASAEQVTKLRGLMRTIGLNRFLPASDWNYPIDLRRYYANEQNSLGLTDAEWRTLATNQAPYLEAPGRSCGPGSSCCGPAA